MHTHTYNVTWYNDLHSCAQHTNTGTHSYVCHMISLSLPLSFSLPISLSEPWLLSRHEQYSCRSLDVFERRRCVLGVGDTDWQPQVCHARDVDSWTPEAPCLLRLPRYNEEEICLAARQTLGEQQIRLITWCAFS